MLASGDKGRDAVYLYVAVAAGEWLAFELFPGCLGESGKGRNMAEEIRAPLAGTVVSILVEPGAKIDVDDELLVIEAMKMENLVYAPSAGVVSQIKTHAGSKVEAGDLLLVID
jgi:biotin carboxyl carrier protein